MRFMTGLVRMLLRSKDALVSLNFARGYLLLRNSCNLNSFITELGRSNLAQRLVAFKSVRTFCSKSQYCPVKVSVFCLRCVSSSDGRYMMIPTQVCSPLAGPCAGDMRDEEDAVHLCSIGECAAIPNSSIPRRRFSMKRMSLPLLFSYSPVGKHTSHTHCCIEERFAV